MLGSTAQGNNGTVVIVCDRSTRGKVAMRGGDAGWRCGEMCGETLASRSLASRDRKWAAPDVCSAEGL